MVNTNSNRQGAEVDIIQIKRQVERAMKQTWSGTINRKEFTRSTKMLIQTYRKPHYETIKDQWKAAASSNTGIFQNLSPSNGEQYNTGSKTHSKK